MKNMSATLLLAKLDAAVGDWAIKASHDALLNYLRASQQAWPDWDAYPRGRDIFTQRWP